ncbi:uncharacterized protein LOC131944675 [Physella acuta]|uniref:uncharacterized protein LOC131944675 n=1 Tax=Physella acuta TaxID=109671 RepID=UPI0027DB006D|nr:uncharacterized protein LOC131944675 [Physella acuta]
MAGHKKMKLSFGDYLGPLPLSYTDIRRVAAEHAADRLTKLLNKQCGELDKGSKRCTKQRTVKLKPTVDHHLEEIKKPKLKRRPERLDIDDKHIKAVTRSWSYVVKYQDVLGPRIISFYLDHCPNHAQFYNNLTSGSLSSNKDGCHLIKQISEVLKHIKSASVLKDVIATNFECLLRAGYTRKSMQECCESYLSFMKEYLPSPWPEDVEKSWKILLDRLIDFAFKYCLNPNLGNPKKKTAFRRSLPLRR